MFLIVPRCVSIVSLSGLLLEVLQTTLSKLHFRYSPRLCVYSIRSAFGDPAGYSKEVKWLHFRYCVVYSIRSVSGGERVKSSLQMLYTEVAFLLECVPFLFHLKDTIGYTTQAVTMHTQLESLIDKQLGPLNPIVTALYNNYQHSFTSTQVSNSLQWLQPFPLNWALVTCYTLHTQAKTSQSTKAQLQLFSCTSLCWTVRRFKVDHLRNSPRHSLGLYSMVGDHFVCFIA